MADMNQARNQMIANTKQDAAVSFKNFVCFLKKLKQ